jgi:hypothetical protein
MSDDNSLRRLDEMLVAYAEVSDPEQKKRFLRAIALALTDEVAQLHARLTKLTAALAIAVGGGATVEAQEIRNVLRGILRPNDARLEKKKPFALVEKRGLRTVSREPPGRLLKIAAVRDDR